MRWPPTAGAFTASFVSHQSRGRSIWLPSSPSLAWLVGPTTGRGKWSRACSSPHSYHASCRGLNCFNEPACMLRWVEGRDHGQGSESHASFPGSPPRAGCALISRLQHWTASHLASSIWLRRTASRDQQKNHLAAQGLGQWGKRATPAAQNAPETREYEISTTNHGGPRKGGIVKLRL